MNIICMGDSIMQYNDCTTYPQTGWVQLLERFFPADTVFRNFARNGRSTKSFIAEGRFDKVLKSVCKGDYALIQFAHNDEKMNDPERYTEPSAGGEFRRNLSFFVTELQKAGAFPILLTPVARRKFTSDGKIENTHGVYPAAVIETAKELGVPCIDMTSLSSAYFESLGEEKSLACFMNFAGGFYSNYPDGKEDNSHLRPDGAFAVSLIAAKEIVRLGEEFSEYKRLSDSVVINPSEKSGSDREIDDEHLMA